MYRLCLQIWKAKRKGILKFDALGVTEVTLAGTCFGFIFASISRAVAVIVNTREENSRARTMAVAAQAIFILFFVISLTFLGASMLLVVHQSAKLETGADRYRRNIFFGATTIGVVLTIAVLVLSLSAEIFALALLALVNTFILWAIYHVLHRRLQKNYSTSVTSSHPAIQIITALANHLVLSIWSLLTGTLFFTISFVLGQQQQSLTLLGPVCGFAFMLNMGTLFIVMSIMVRSVERLSKNRVEARGAVEVLNVEISKTSQTIKRSDRNQPYTAGSVSGAPLISNSSGFDDNEVRKPRSHSKANANVVFPSFPPTNSIEDMGTTSSDKHLTIDESDGPC
jgi:hypothetical protein